MYYVYVIQDVQDSSHVYIGYTHDLKRRMHQHNSSENRGYTKSKQWRLVYYESYLSEKDARMREKRLKMDGRARYQLMRRLEHSLTVD